MKILAINGSPRKGGNTDLLLDKVLEGGVSTGAETEKIYLEDLNIAPCSEKEYGNVTADGLSVVNDDIQLIFKKIKESDCLVLGSPVFFGSLSAQMKTMIDRFQCIWYAKEILGKNIFTREIKGVFLSVSGAKNKSYFENAKFIIRHFFSVINAKYTEELFCGGVDKKGDVLKDPELLQKAFDLGRKIVGTGGRP